MQTYTRIRLTSKQGRHAATGRQNVRTALLLGLVLTFFLAPAAFAQTYLNQRALNELLERTAQDLDALPEVQYNYYVVEEASTLRARLMLYKVFGEENRELIILLNRNTLESLQQGDTLVVPDRFDLDLRAYSPFPRYYPGAREFDKLMILDKDVQAFGAYEYGQLVRWGIINTGKEETKTPNGRFNFNWKSEYRRSSVNWEWEMHWVVNFHEARGIHIHQYAMPTGGPASYGCVRLVDADARWAYEWTDGWVRQGSRIVKQGTTLLVIGEDSPDKPNPFLYKSRYPVLKMVELPAHPYDVEPGTEQQVHFDRLRAQQQRASR